MFRRIKYAPSVITIVCVIIAWEAAVSLFSVPAYVLPAPSRVFGAMFALPKLSVHLGATLFEALAGLFLAVALSVLLSLCMDAFPAFKRAVYPLLVASQTVPIIVLAPIMLLYLGFGYGSKIITVVLMCFFPIAVSFTDALAAVPVPMINLLRLMGASRIQRYTFAKLPCAVPGFFSGLRIAATYCVMGAVVGEWLGGDRGLGFLMLRLKNAYALDKVFAVILYIVLASFTIYLAAWLLEYFWSRKRP